MAEGGLRPPVRTPVMEADPLRAEDYLVGEAGSGTAPADCLRRTLAGWLGEACAGCGVPPKDLLVLSGLGEPRDPSAFLRCYAVRGLGPQALPFCLGARAANPGLRVVVFSPAGAAETARLLSAARLGLDATCLVLNGGCGSGGSAGAIPLLAVPGAYGPPGTAPRPDVPALALSAGAGFAARVWAGMEREEGVRVFRAALQHKGFSVVDCAGACPACDGAHGPSPVPLDRGHDPSDKRAALLAASQSPEKWPAGVLYDGIERSWEEREPVLSRWGAPAVFGAREAAEAGALERLWDGLR